MQANHSSVLLCPNPHEQTVLVDSDCELVRVDVELIGIDEIRTLITEAHRQPIEGFVKKHIVLSGIKITREAEQAALKILEEPPETVSISIILPSGTHLLDTVLSRVDLKNLDPNSHTTELTDWLQLPYDKRIELVNKKIKDKDMVWMQAIKGELQQYFQKNNHLDATEIKELQLVVENLLTRGASNKMLLEHLALTLPLTT